MWRWRNWTPISGQAGLDSQGDGQEGFARAGRPEKDHVLSGLDEGQGRQVQHHLAADAGLVGEVELLYRFASGEASGLDASLASMGLAGQDLSLKERLPGNHRSSTPLDGPARSPWEAPERYREPSSGGSGRGERSFDRLRKELQPGPGLLHARAQLSAQLPGAVQMLWDRDDIVMAEAAGVRGDGSALVEDLHPGGTEADLQPFSGQDQGNGSIRWRPHARSPSG